MRREFVRYGLARERVMVGVLQCLGAFGLILGLHWPWIGRAAAGGLALLMLLGVGVRIRVKDSFLQASQALFYFGLNAWICWRGF